MRSRAYAVDHGNYAKGVTTGSAPIVDETNRAVMAMSAVGFSAQLTKPAIRQLGEELHERASQVSRALSGQMRQLELSIGLPIPSASRSLIAYCPECLDAPRAWLNERRL